ncbi:hypothetical protein GCM10028803_04600 [Larkinella knui]|uniref:Uncharacterized protein n=1 Tax=Larkinella knui TaxID=2025310 RepID=A0A3P1CKK4_9BACT|nr:hypothetical protein [Larkinella knui]RRB13861.1 hypothetical protein EHT87_16520 [Larkinella knui]
MNDKGKQLRHWLLQLAQHAAMLPGHTYTVVANASMCGNEALLFCQQLNVSGSVAGLLADFRLKMEHSKRLRLTTTNLFLKA